MTSSAQVTLIQDCWGSTLTSKIKWTLTQGFQRLSFYLLNHLCVLISQSLSQTTFILIEGRSITDLGLLFDCSVVFLSAGMPYWYYRWYHPKLSTDTELGNNNHADLRDHWLKVARAVPDVWKTHKPIVGVALASVALNFAITMNLTTGQSNLSLSSQSRRYRSVHGHISLPLYLLCTD
jgi:hypothetical protein